MPAVRVAVDGRVVAGLVDEAREARGARVVAVSAAGRVVRGRFVVAVAAAVVVEPPTDGLDAAFPGDARAAAVDSDVPGRRTVGFFFSSPDVNEDTSGSASEAVLEDEMVLRAVVPGAGRVGGLLKLDPAVLVREVVVEGAFDAVVEVRVLLTDGAAGRRALAAVLLVAVGRRGAAASLEAGEGALEAILRRTDDVGVEGAGSFFGCGLPTAKLSEGGLSRAEPWLAGVGVVSIGSLLSFRGQC